MEVTSRDMAAVDDFDEVLERYNLALGGFYKGTPSPYRGCGPIEKT